MLKILFVFFSIAVIHAGNACARDISIGTYVGSNFDLDRVRKALADMNLIVGSSSSPEDFPCPVLFRLESFTIDPRMPPIVRSEADIWRARNLGYDVAIVSGINYCGYAGRRFVGCTPLGYSGIVIVDSRNPAFDGALLAHEYGHTRGLGHSGNPRGIMRTGLGRKFQLTKSECDAFR